MSEKIWDLTPEGGGEPCQVDIGNPSEAIAAHPERYTRKAPDGTVQAAIAKRDAERAAKVAAIEAEKNAKFSEIAKAKQAKLDAIAKEAADAKKTQLEKDRAATEKAAKDSGIVPDRRGQIAAIESEANAASELAQHEADEKKKVLDAGK